jgi:hypothetical protein
MKHRAARSAAMIMTLTLVGCGGDEAARNDDGPGGGGTPSSPEGDAAPTGTDGDFEELAAYDWTIGGGVEAYYCEYRTLSEDLFISDFRPIMPSGTHHVVLGYGDPTQPDGVYPESEAGCTGTTFGDIYTYVATVGTEELSMPEGVAVKIPAGKQLVYGLHVFNSGAEPLSGHSGLAVVSPDPSEVEQEAEVLAITDFTLDIPPGTTTETSTCTMTHDTTIFAVLPHMHLTGVHMNTVAELSDGSEATLLDLDYDFTDQSYTKLDPPLFLEQGTVTRISCTYENPGPETFTFGESTTNGEMCITFAYRYPAVTSTLPVNTSLGFPLARSACFDSL